MLGAFNQTLHCFYLNTFFFGILGKFTVTTRVNSSNSLAFLGRPAHIHCSKLTERVIRETSWYRKRLPT